MDDEVSIIGLDLAKNVFQVHGAGQDGRMILRKKLNRSRLLEFFAKLPRCVVAMEACASAHYWGREIGKFGHEVRLIHPSYVKPFVKRQKNDAADAEAIAEAASRPTMRFVGVKSAEKQASSMAFKVRDLLVRQRTQAINALRGHLAEYGLIVAQGVRHIPRLHELLTIYPDLPDLARGLCQTLLKHVESLSEQIAELEKGLRVRARQDEVASRLMTIPGIGAICATAIEPWRPRRRPFPRGVILRPGLVSRPNRILPEARTGLAKSPGWAGEISDGSSCLVPPPWCDGQDDMDRQQDPGSRECS